MKDTLEKIEQWAGILEPGLLIFGLACILIEIILLKLFNKYTSDRGSFVSLLSAGIANIPGFLGFGIIYLNVAFWFYNHRIFDIGFEWYWWVVLVFLRDFIEYWAHRLHHEVRLLWCLHFVHHTPREMKLATAVRGSIFDFLSGPWFFVWIGVLGFHPFMYIVATSIIKVWGLLQHINEDFVGKWPMLNKIFITPDVHRVHHGKNYQYLDRNYAEVFSIWDRLFGTYEEYEEKPVYGVLKELDNDNFFQIQFEVWKDLWQDLKSTKGFLNKLKILFMPPGWYPDNQEMTAKRLREKYFEGLHSRV